MPSSRFRWETERPIVSLLTLLNDGMEIAIYGNADERTLKELALEMREEIAALAGISRVEVTYVRPDEISIEVSEETAAAAGTDVRPGGRLGAAHIAGHARRIDQDGRRGNHAQNPGTGLSRRGLPGHRPSCPARDGTRVFLDEVANIVDGFQEGDTQARFDGLPAAMIKVYQVGDEDVVEIAEQVTAYVEEARSRMPDGIELTIWQDESQVLRDRIDILPGSRRKRAGPGADPAHPAAAVSAGHVGWRPEFPSPCWARSPYSGPWASPSARSPWSVSSWCWASWSTMPSWWANECSPTNATARTG